MNSFVNNYERISRFQNKKCFFGIGLYGKMKIFYKEFNTNFDMEKEIEGYSIVKKYYTVLNQYIKSIKNIKKINENMLCNNSFYKKRIDMIHKYLLLINTQKQLKKE